MATQNSTQKLVRGIGAGIEKIKALMEREPRQTIAFLLVTMISFPLFTYFYSTRYEAYKKFEPWFGVWVDTNYHHKIVIEPGFFWGYKVTRINGKTGEPIKIHHFKFMEGTNELQIEGSGYEDYKFTWYLKLPQGEKLAYRWVVHSPKFPDNVKNQDSEFLKVLWSQVPNQSEVLLSSF